MKKAAYKLFKPMVFQRALRVREKQQARLERLQKVMEGLREFDDIPISYQFESLCHTLKIKPNEAAKNFIYGLNFGKIDVEKESKKLPLI